MEKLTQKDGQSKDILADNIARLKQLFPEVFAEGGIDFAALKEVLGEYLEERDERYSFTWNGKSRAKRLAQTPSTGTLLPSPDESVNWDSTKNLFIEGDNLEVLKLLQKSYHKKVKMIYIDPPYNTGGDFIYKDDYRDNLKNYLAMTGQLDAEGRRYSTNAETSGRYHTDWLNMMYPRLKLARNLLRDDGVIFISIDDHEVANLRKICDEIFGEENLLGTICWKKKTNGNNMGYIPPVHDYFIVYAKIASEECLVGVPLSKDYIGSKYSNRDNDPKGPWTTTDLSANHKGPYFPIVNPNTGETFYPPEGRYWVFGEQETLKRISDGRIIFGKSGEGRPVQKKYLSERISDRRKAESWWDKHGLNEDGTEELGELIKSKIFDHPKPSATLKHLVNIATEKDEVVLDFFSGTAPAAHAVLELNQEDSGNRKFLMIQLPEPCDVNSVAYEAGYSTIAEIGKERIRRVISKIKTENPEYNGDLGFKVFKLDASNIKPWDVNPDDLKESILDMADNIRSERSEQDVLYELLLKYGLDLTIPIEQREFAAKTVHIIGAGALVICLEKEITLEVVEAIAGLKDELDPELMRVVFKDSGFKDDVDKTNAVQILRQKGIEDVRSL